MVFYSGRVLAEDGMIMPITVTKVSEAFYRVSATPPHVSEPWSAPGPLRMHQVCDELIARGVHHIDASDAITDADREWLNSKQRAGA